MSLLEERTDGPDQGEDAPITQRCVYVQHHSRRWCARTIDTSSALETAQAAAAPAT